MTDFTIVIPVHNEAENAGPLVEEIVEVLRDWNHTYTMVIVDDGSTDGTPGKLKELKQKYPALEAYALPVQQRKSAALAAGFHRARSPYVITFDGDLQNDPRDIPEVARHAAPKTLVCGVRRQRMDRATKRIGSRLANFVRRMLLDDVATDTGCGLKVFPIESRDVIPWIRGVHRFFPSVLKRHGYRILNIPVSDRPRTRGLTKYSNLGRLITTTQDLFGFWWLLRRQMDYDAEEITEKKFEV